MIPLPNLNFDQTITPSLDQLGNAWNLGGVWNFNYGSGTQAPNQTGPTGGAVSKMPSNLSLPTSQPVLTGYSAQQSYALPSAINPLYVLAVAALGVFWVLKK